MGFVLGIAVLAGLFALLVPRATQAQGSTADVLGTVTDPSGAVVPNAKVVALNTATGITRTVQSGANGDYVITALQIGTYKVTVEAKGFKTFVEKDITLAAGDRMRVEAKLSLGAASETVEVSTSEVQGLQTDDSTVGTLVSPTSVEDLPLNGRNLTELVQYSAGITPGVQNSISNGSRDADRRETSAYSANGQMDIYNSNLIDGMDNNERFVGTMGVKPSIDAIQEVKVSTDLYSAEYSRAVGGVVDVITKSGTNNLHGSAYEFLRNDAVDARDYFDTVGTVNKNELRQNQFGGSFGGPIRKNKTFIFGDYEGFRQISGYDTSQSVVPNITYDASGDAVFTESDTLSTPGHPIPYTITVPAGQMTALGKALLSLYPSPNCTTCGSNNFVAAPNRSQFSHTLDVRVDQHINDKDSVYARYSWNKVHTFLAGSFPAAKVGGQTYYAGGPVSGTQGATGDSHELVSHLGIGYTHIFKPSLLLELKASYMRFNNQNLAVNGQDAGTKLGIVCDTTDCSNVEPSLGGSGAGLAGIQFSGNTSTANGPQGNICNNCAVAAIGDGHFTPLFDINNTFTYNGALTWTHGAHSVKAGLSLTRRQMFRVQSGNAQGTISFDGSYTDIPNPNAALPGAPAYLAGDDLADLLLGASAGVGRQEEIVNPHYRFWEPGGYVKDDWRIKPSLTLNLGIRYDIFSPMTEIDGYISNFDLASGLIVGPDLLGANHSSKTAGVNTDFADVQPRFGFAWSLHHGMVVRGGYGLTYFPTAQGPSSALNNAPYAFSSNYADVASPGTLQNPTSLTPLTRNLGGTLYNYVNLQTNSIPVPVYDTAQVTDTANYAGQQGSFMASNFFPARTQQYSLQVEKQLGVNVVTLGYVGNYGMRLSSLPNVQSFITCVTPQEVAQGATVIDPSRNCDAGLPYPNLPDSFTATTWESTASGVYNAMQLSIRRQLAHGLTGNANWTWSHITNNTQAPIEGPGGGVPNCNQSCYEDVPGGQPKYIADGWKSYDWGNGDEDVRHRVTVILSYNLPFAKSATGVLGAIAKGWAVNTVEAWQTGLPIVVADPGGPPGSAGPSGQLGPHGDRPDQLANPMKAGTVAGNSTNCSAPTQVRTLSNWFNTCAYIEQADGLNGDERRNSLYGPHAQHWDLSVGKEFAIHEQMKIQFRAEGFNITNTPNFGLPGTNMASSFGQAQQGGGPGGGPPGPPFGSITATATGSNPRQMQFALRLTY
jgi:hypothetical protein